MRQAGLQRETMLGRLLSGEMRNREAANQYRHRLSIVVLGVTAFVAVCALLFTSLLG